jgi:hypothetical protein
VLANLFFLRNAVRGFITNSAIDANIFLTTDNFNTGNIGITWLGSMCYTDSTYRAAIIEYFKTDTNTAEVRGSKVEKWLGPSLQL